MRNNHRAVWLLAAVLAAACEVPATGPDDAGADATVADAGPDVDAAGPLDTAADADSAGLQDTQDVPEVAEVRPEVAPTDVPPETDVAADAGPDLDADAGGPADTAEVTAPGTPVLSSVSARQVGARGVDLRIAVAGSDSDKNTRLLRVRLFKGEEPAKLFRVEETGGMSHEGVMPFDSLGEVFGRATFAGLVTLRGLLKPGPQLPTRLTVELIDSAGLASASIDTPLQLQDLMGLGETCDTFFVENRCELGLVCRSTRCQLGPPPYVSRISYFVDAGGARILVEGVDTDDDFAQLVFTYIDPDGQPVMVDWDEDGATETGEDLRDVTYLRGDGSFYYRIDVPESFLEIVTGVTVVAVDSRSQLSAVKRTQQTVAPTRATEQVCDPRGFDLCRTGDKCLKALDGQFRCQMVEDYRARICENAPFLPLDGTPVTGVASGPSGYDPPPLCAANDSSDKSEGLVRVRLQAPATRLVITTDHPGTTFDTVVYVYAGCGNDAAGPLDCVDDIAGPPTRPFSTLELQDIGAGDYLVVVDAWGQGGSFQVSARAEFE